MRSSAPGLPESVARLVRSRLWVRLEGGERTGSTNDDCRALAAAGAPEGTAVIALEQTAGRGRLGRTWRSPRDGVYLSALLRPDLPPEAAGALPLAVGLGVAEGLESLGARVCLKWPNDVLAEAGGGKLAGILLERGGGASGAWIVAGVGVNVAPPDPAGEVDREPGGTHAVHLAGLLGHAPGPEAVAAAVLDGIAGAYSRFTAGGFAPMLGEYEARSALSGRDVVVRDAHGAVVAEGRVAGIDVSGGLVLETDAGRRTVTAGDVTLRAPG